MQRASCLLLLIALGDQDPQVIDVFNSLDHYTTSSPSQDKKSPATESIKIPFNNGLDAFSVPAFFILLEALLQHTDDHGFVGSKVDFNLLRRVSACYIKSTEHMQSNSYHRKVAWCYSSGATVTIVYVILHVRASEVGIRRPPLL